MEASRIAITVEWKVAEVALTYEEPVPWFSNPMNPVDNGSL